MQKAKNKLQEGRYAPFNKVVMKTVKKRRNVKSLKTSTKPALVISREALKSIKVVYIARANKKIKYPWDTSYIAYIGETSKGISRITASAAKRAPEILSQHGFKDLTFYIVKSGSKQNVKTWEELERSLLVLFRERFGGVPICNTQGKGLKQKSKSPYFNEDRLRKIINKYSDEYRLS